MNIQSMIEPTWNSVQSAHSDGFLHNHEMFAFAFCKALPEKIRHIKRPRQGEPGLTMQGEHAKVSALVGTLRESKLGFSYQSTILKHGIHIRTI